MPGISLNVEDIIMNKYYLKEQTFLSDDRSIFTMEHMVQGDTFVQISIMQVLGKCKGPSVWKPKTKGTKRQEGMPQGKWEGAKGELGHLKNVLRSVPWRGINFSSSILSSSPFLIHPWTHLSIWTNQSIWTMISMLLD